MLRTINWYAHFAGSLVAMKHVKRSGANVTVHGLENIPDDRAVLFVSNHQSNFDIALFMSYINKPKGYISKAEMNKVPLIRTWMKYIHCVFMDRSNIKQSAKAIVQGVQNLRAGHSMVIFPEGTRSKGDKMLEFKAGSFKLATKAKVPIVPVTISGTYKLMEANNNMIKPANVELYIHPMIETANLTKDEEKELHTKVQKIIESKLPH